MSKSVSWLSRRDIKRNLMPKTALIDIACEVVKETEKAYGITDGTPDEPDAKGNVRNKLFWVPKSQCQWDPDTETLTLPEWLALEKGLI